MSGEPGARDVPPVAAPEDPSWVRVQVTPYVPTRDELAGPRTGSVAAVGGGWVIERHGRPGGRVGRLGGTARAGLAQMLALPSSLAHARWAPSRRAVSGAVAAVLLAAGVFGLRVAWAREAGAGTPVAGLRAAGLPGGAATARGSGAVLVTAAPSPPGPASAGVAAPASVGVAAPASGGAVLVVHVVGQVVRPGIVRLPPGSRVVDAVTAAGGARRGADVAGLNLARLVIDGEQIRVPRVGEALAAPAAGSPASAGGDAAGALVSLNAADVTVLDSLPGIGPVLAQRIVDWRTENGRFTSVDELGEVSGIGEKLLAQLRPKVTL